ncbi:MAG: amino acid-binding protein [Thermoplasmata archaeon]
MKNIKEYFREYTGQEKVAKYLLETGLSVGEGNIYCNGVKMSPSKIGRVLGVDRRTVTATVDTIENTEDIRDIFGNLRSTAFFKDVAMNTEAGLIEVIPTDPHQTGILAGISKIIAELGISIRQSITEDPEFKEEPKLYVITESPVPMEAIEDMRDVKGVLSVTIY